MGAIRYVVCGMLNMLAMSARVPVLMRARDKIALCYRDSCLRDPGTTTPAFLPTIFFFPSTVLCPFLFLSIRGRYATLSFAFSGYSLLGVQARFRRIVHLPWRCIILSDRASS